MQPRLFWPVLTALTLAFGASCIGPSGPPMSANISSVFPTEFYAGEQVAISAHDLGNLDPDVHWNFGGGAAPNEIVERAPYIVAGMPGTYNGTVSAGGSSFNFTLTVLVPPIPEITAVRSAVPRNETLLDGSPVVFRTDGPLYAGMPGSLAAYGLFQPTGPDSFVGERVPVTSWSWSFEDGAVRRTSAERSPTFMPTTPGTYDGTVVLGNAGGTTEPFEFSYQVRALIPPNPGVVFIDVDNYIPGTRSFVHTYQFDQDPGGPIASYNWNFGGGFTPNTTTSSIPVGSTHTPGVYHGTLTISNPAGSQTIEFTYTVAAF